MMVKTWPLKGRIVTSNWGIKRSRLESPGLWSFLLAKGLLVLRSFYSTFVNSRLVSGCTAYGIVWMAWPKDSLGLSSGFHHPNDGIQFQQDVAWAWKLMARNHWKKWRIVATSPGRLPVQLDRQKIAPMGCWTYIMTQLKVEASPRNQEFYTVKMFVSIMSSLFPENPFKGIPKMQIRYGAVAHMERGLLMAQLIMGMVHAPMTRHDLLSHPQGKLKIMEEAEAMRNLGVWNESEFWEVDELKKHAREQQKMIHVAEWGKGTAFELRTILRRESSFHHRTTSVPRKGSCLVRTWKRQTTFHVNGRLRSICKNPLI